MGWIDRAFEVESIADYLEAEDVLSEKEKVYIWPSRAANTETDLFAELSRNDDIANINALAEEEALNETRSTGLGSYLQLFQKEGSEIGDVPVTSIPEKFGVSEPHEVLDLYRDGKIPDIDLEIGWPASELSEFDIDPAVRRRVAKGKGYSKDLDHAKARYARNSLRAGIKMSNEMAAEDGTVMMRADDFEEYPVGEWLENDSIEDVDTIAFYMQSAFGFEAIYRIDETETGHTYVVGDEPADYDHSSS